MHQTVGLTCLSCLRAINRSRTMFQMVKPFLLYIEYTSTRCLRRKRRIFFRNKTQGLDGVPPQTSGRPIFVVVVNLGRAIRAILVPAVAVAVSFNISKQEYYMLRSRISYYCILFNVCFPPFAALQYSCLKS